MQLLCSYDYSISDSDDEDTPNLKKCIVEFIEESDAEVMSFPPSLTGNERKIVHEVTNNICVLPAIAIFYIDMPQFLMLSVDLSFCLSAFYFIQYG